MPSLLPSHASAEDSACVEVCPIDCIRTDDDSRQFYINPDECVWCRVCEIECPVGAIFEANDLPAEWKHFEQNQRAVF